MAISGFLLLLRLYGWRLLRFITEGTILHPATILHPVTMDQIIITENLIEIGSRGTGRRYGLLMVGRGSGFQAIGNRAPGRQGLF
jgi:hypothetical protein